MHPRARDEPWRFVANGTVSELVGSSGSVYVEVDDRGRAQTLLASLANVSSVHAQGDGWSSKCAAVGGPISRPR